MSGLFLNQPTTEEPRITKPNEVINGRCRLDKIKNHLPIKVRWFSIKTNYTTIYIQKI
jgi:hypothetical protein